MMCQAVGPALRPKGPKLRVAPNQDEQTGEQKAYRPSERGETQAVTQGTLGENNQARKKDKKPGQMVIKLALALVSEEFGLRLRTSGVAHWHVHSRVHGAGRMFLRVERLKAGSKNRKRKRKAEPTHFL